ncbi:MAG: hypothetical protein KIS77_14810 [Saprospiraceae bacterium]|nr:hypothetical protein [Saprospiraceae bacterium]
MQSKSGIFGEKLNEASRKKGFPFAKGIHRNKSIVLFHHRDAKIFKSTGKYLGEGSAPKHIPGRCTFLCSHE